MARITQATNSLTSPVWAGDFTSREHVLPGGAKLVAADFSDEDSVLVTTTSQANAAATSIAVSALSGAIPNGTVLNFTGAGEFAVLTSAAAAGATSLAVEALDATIESGDTARYEGAATVKTVRSGTPVGRTFAERDSGTGFGPAGDSDDEVYLVLYDVYDVDRNNDVELYRHGGIVKENFLPTYSSLSSAVKTKLRTAYQTTKGVA